MASEAIFFFFFFLYILSLSSQFHFSGAQTWVRAGYWYANGEFPIQDINSALFTHLSCAFAEVNSSNYQLFIPSASEQYFSTFATIVKRRNPAVKALLSVWNGISATGKSISGEKVNDSVLSSMVSSSSTRKSFIDSSIKTARRYGFHGIDFFWVWPNSTDLSSIGVLLDEWRAAINSEPRKSGESQLILTMAIRYLPTIGMVTYPIESVRRNVDWAHVVAYDYHLPTRENFTGVHAALYNPSGNVSTDFGIREWLNKGMPPSKLVLGLPYHGYAWKLVNSQDNAVGAPASGPAVTMDGSMGYKAIKSYIRDYGYGAASVYNATYVVNLFTSPTIWINFDGVEAVKAKISYAKERKLAGFKAFQLSNDENWVLSRAAQEGENQGNKQQLLLKIILPVSLFVILAMAILYYLRRRKVKSKGKLPSTMRIGTGANGEMALRSIPSPRADTSAAENFGSDASHLQVFKFSNIREATNNFSIANKLGEGGFGPVYKAYELWTNDKGPEFIDTSLDDSSSSCKIMRCMQIALLCVQENPDDRPTMLEVFGMLRNDSVATTAPKRPAFSVKADKNTGSTSASQQEIWSFNDPQISQLEPR
ncbi:hypothetical protein V6N11_066257 [Hibiscus sabdariffa]|uniref:GH18 domain-containing protein n=1 Tax=Hibiscus sabdariffa TaxID=183260 RepID=A0ABR1ZQG8_9ROSI